MYKYLIPIASSLNIFWEKVLWVDGSREWLKKWPELVLKTKIKIIS